MLTPKTIKTNAKTELKQNWVAAIFAVTVLLCVIFAVLIFNSLILDVFGISVSVSNKTSVAGAEISLILSLFSAILILPVFQGTIRWFWALITDEVRPLSEIFYYFSSKKRFFNLIQLYALIIGRLFIIYVLCLLPWGICSVLLAENSIKIHLLAVLITLGSFAFLALALKYVHSNVLIIINEDLSPYNAVKLSCKISRVNRFPQLIIALSFAGFVLLSFLGITIIYTLPFMLCSYVVYVRFSITDYCLKTKTPLYEFYQK